MQKMTLNGDNWRMRIVGEKDVYGVNGKTLPAKIPGSVYGNLLAQGLMPDPYDRMNELTALPLMDNDFIFETDFTLTEEQLAGDFLILRFDGVDTLAKVYLNGRLLGHTDNMHRVWEFLIAHTAKVGRMRFAWRLLRRPALLRKKIGKFLPAAPRMPCGDSLICAKRTACLAGIGVRGCLTRVFFGKCL